MAKDSQGVNTHIKKSLYAHSTHIPGCAQICAAFHSYQFKPYAIRCFIMRAALLALALTATTATAQPGPHPVLRIDQATAVIEGNCMIVSAKGAVATGGWEHPRLIAKKSPHERGDIELEFVATPPEDTAVVAQSIVPVSVSVRTYLPRSGVAAVRVISQTNSVTAQIIPKKDHPNTAK